MRKNIICHVNYNHVENGTIPKYVLEPHRITRKLFLNMHDFFFAEFQIFFSHECLRQQTFQNFQKQNFKNRFLKIAIMYDHLSRKMVVFWTILRTDDVMMTSHYCQISKTSKFRMSLIVFQSQHRMKATQLRIMPPDKHDLSQN